VWFVDGHFRLAVSVAVILSAKEGTATQRGQPEQALAGCLSGHGFSLLWLNRRCQLLNNSGIAILFPKTAMNARNFLQAYRESEAILAAIGMAAQ